MNLPFDLFQTGPEAVAFMMRITPYMTAALILFYVVIGLILNFHWSRYAAAFVPTQIFRLMYIVIGGILILAMGGAQLLL